ncbi:immunoglobulin domain-containing protein precursor [Danio rerio]|uniref:Si:ch211-196f2.6 n=1 Tax=Danio rerio TaxID=7955 RepID=A0A1D5NSD6_DANRE|nr:immunoglobulin domain-containing protein precursor [Danio rerio]|eukprot:XP_001342941.1 uncharacterized protein si:ch211-196f2.6 [Danio rerio]
MSRNFLCAFLTLAFLESGKSNSDVSISHRFTGDSQNITCVLLGDENMTQINWEILHGPNHTKLGTYHPHFGIHIMHNYKTKVEIKGRQSPRPSSSSLLIKIASNESVQICCAFITFPSGKLEQCVDISKKDASIDTSKKEYTYMQSERKLGLFGLLGAMITGTILCLFILILLIYLWRKCNCRRIKSFEIRTYMTDSPAEGEQSVDAATAQSSPTGFDPSKLYAKIRKDLFYGRLWKSYQGQPKP